MQKPQHNSPGKNNNDTMELEENGNILELMRACKISKDQSQVELPRAVVLEYYGFVETMAGLPRIPVGKNDLKGFKEKEDKESTSYMLRMLVVSRLKRCVQLKDWSTLNSWVKKKGFSSVIKSVVPWLSPDEWLQLLISPVLKNTLPEMAYTLSTIDQLYLAKDWVNQTLLIRAIDLADVNVCKFVVRESPTCLTNFSPNQFIKVLSMLSEGMAPGEILGVLLQHRALFEKTINCEALEGLRSRLSWCIKQHIMCKDSADLLAYLLGIQATTTVFRTDDMQCLLKIASAVGATDVAKVLLQHGKSNPDESLSGSEALNTSMKFGSSEVTEFVIFQLGIDTSSVSDETLRHLVHHVASQADAKWFEKFLIYYQGKPPFPAVLLLESVLRDRIRSNTATPLSFKLHARTRKLLMRNYPLDEMCSLGDASLNGVITGTKYVEAVQSTFHELFTLKRRHTMAMYRALYYKILEVCCLNSNSICAIFSHDPAFVAAFSLNAHVSFLPQILSEQVPDSMRSFLKFLPKEDGQLVKGPSIPRLPSMEPWKKHPKA